MTKQELKEDYGLFTYLTKRKIVIKMVSSR